MPPRVFFHAVGWTFARNHSLLVHRAEFTANLLFPGNVFVLHLVDKLFHATVRVKLDHGSRNPLARLLLFLFGLLLTLEAFGDRLLSSVDCALFLEMVLGFVQEGLLPDVLVHGGQKLVILQQSLIRER